MSRAAAGAVRSPGAGSRADYAVAAAHSAEALPRRHTGAVASRQVGIVGATGQARYTGIEHARAATAAPFQTRRLCRGAVWPQANGGNGAKGGLQRADDRAPARCACSELAHQIIESTLLQHVLLLSLHPATEAQCVRRRSRCFRNSRSNTRGRYHPSCTSPSSSRRMGCTVHCNRSRSSKLRLRPVFREMMRNRPVGNCRDAAFRLRSHTRYSCN
jgi:hypothetical protein